MNSNESLKCPKCGADLPSDAPQGLCPRCLAAMNLVGDTLENEDAPGAERSLTPEELAPHFPPLEIIECLGRGGMGVVYKARQKALNRLVALKLLAPEREKDAQFAERFTREAQSLACLAHPHIVTVHDFGQAGSFFYLLMEYVDGVNLRQALNARRFTPEQALAIVPPVCEALQYAHENGIVHRDIKPENLLLDKAGRVKIADFGIAKMLRTDGAGDAPDESQSIGTPQYMAPEQRNSPRTADHRADIYSLGVVLYEMLTGELPDASFRPPSQKVTIDVRLDEIVLRALEKSPELRWQTAEELRTRVETITTPTFPPAANSNKGSARVLDAIFQYFLQLSPQTRVLAVVTVFLLVSGLIALFSRNSLSTPQVIPMDQADLTKRIEGVQRNGTGDVAGIPQVAQKGLSATATDGKSMEAARIRIRAAENEFKRATDLHDAKLISEGEYQKPRLALELARAELSGDPKEVARIRVRAAEESLNLAKLRREAGLMSEEEFQKNVTDLELAQAELAGDPAEMARIRVRAAERALERSKALRDNGMISEGELQKAVLALELARAELGNR